MIIIKESQKIEPYQRTKKLWNMKMTVLLIIVGVLGTVPISFGKRLEKLEIRGRIETIKTTALRSA